MTHTNGTTGRTGPVFEISDLHVSVEGKRILRGVNLVVCPGEVHALMGRNGSGKSTLANAVMGHPKYQITAGSVRLDGEDVLSLRPDERAKRGLFLAFQNPIAIPGVATGNFLRAAVKAVRGTETINAVQFRKELTERMLHLKMDPSFASRALNEGFSGGEKKRAEMLQLAMLKPRVAILDEPDSGLDIDAVRIVSDGINTVHEQQPEMGVLLITHYQRILNYVQPDRVHVMARGRIVESGGAELVQQLESEGYDPILRRLGIGEEGAEEANSNGR
jgi:Fe-S cluster assembly ATP-binding protein